MHDFDHMPGAEHIARGLEDASRGDRTLHALLVWIGAPRLRWLGIPVPPDAHPQEGFPEHRLYGLLEDEPNPHSAYNAWIRLLVSFERALERERSAAGAFDP